VLFDNAIHNFEFVFYYQVGAVVVFLGLLCFLVVPADRRRQLGLPVIWFLVTFLPTIVYPAPRLDIVLAPTIAVFIGVLMLTHSALFRMKLRKTIRIMLIVLLLYAIVVQVSGYQYTNVAYGNYWREGTALQNWVFSLKNGTVVMDSLWGEMEMPGVNPYNPVMTTQWVPALNSSQPPVYACVRAPFTLHDIVMTHPDSFRLVYHHSTSSWYFFPGPGRFLLSQNILGVITYETSCWLEVNNKTSAASQALSSKTLFSSTIRAGEETALRLSYLESSEPSQFELLESLQINNIVDSIPSSSNSISVISTRYLVYVPSFSEKRIVC
jgi:hypothetical protein